MVTAIKKKYDSELLKLQKYKTPECFPYINKSGKKYEMYFHNNYKKFLLDLMKDIEGAEEAYNSGAGGELKEHTKVGIQIPPKMLSVASSSRFCFLSLKNLNPEIFGAKKGSKSIEFEKKLHILDKGTPPHMDAFYDAEDYELYFECKCHEMFDYHPIELSTKYFSDNLLRSKELKVIKETEFKKVIDPVSFGITTDKTNLIFDIKQLLTHLMGIQQNKKKKAKLIYFYFIPDAIEKNEVFTSKIQGLYSEAKKIFTCDFIQEFIKDKEIEIELYVQTSNIVENATRENTIRKYPVLK